MNDFGIKPADIHLDYDPFAQDLINTLGRAELEFAAAMVIRWHHVHSPDVWVSVSRREIAQSITDPVIEVWAQNPFFRPDWMQLLRLGFIAGWNADVDARGHLTEKFFAAYKREHDRRAAKLVRLNK
jgi:hypothetical protein